ncbi:sulfite exporter TauE/SafE family protein [Streptomyces sp. DG2A-72]|uniref:sulfite exporter TauE/SafE family protein n=1 Tax=Streptomyces sp. DG2A-72 TaxID=3051386 RepID=UPI00265C56C9|nr:sulfite exporter TauE/SafE family protein [Streptomyces sp. DG2A-72]MDO0938829.1 sulfite exporter TauE/SafE family protein [Streptomyces sp. DG2A-72]
MSALILALCAGAVTGLALGALGGGGSVLTVPALIYLLHFTPAAATTASLAIVAVTSATALTAYARDGHVHWRTGLLFAAAGSGPAMVGSAVAGGLPGPVLTAAFGVLASVAAVRMLRGPGPTDAGQAVRAGRPTRPGRSVRLDRRTRAGESFRPDGQADAGRSVPLGPSADAELPDRHDLPTDYGPPDRPSRQTHTRQPVSPGRAAAAGAGLGAVTGVLGVGGGFLAVPALTGLLGLRMRAAVGTSLLVITVNSLAALAWRGGSVDVLDWAAVGPFAGAAVLGAWDGRRLAAKASARALHRTFALALLAVAAFMLIDSVW